MIRKMFYALLLVSLSDNKEQCEFAKQIATEIVCKIRKVNGTYTINNHDQKMLQKYFDIKFKEE